MSNPRTRAGRLAFVALSMAASQALAADRTWTGIATNGNFSNTSNWAFFTPPGSGDRALFTSTTATRSIVLFDANPTVAAMTVSGSNSAGAYNFQSSGSFHGVGVTGLFEVNASSGATNLTINNGMLLSAGTINVQTANSVAVSGAGTSVSTSGTLLLAGTGSMNVNTAATVSGFIDHNSLLTSAVTSATVNAKGFDIRGNGIFDINAGGAFNLDNDPYGNASDGVIRAGTLRLNASGTLGFVGVRTMEVTATGLFDLKREYILPANQTLKLTAGGDVASTSYFDIANAGGGTISIDGAGSTFTSGGGTRCDWGSNMGNATVTLSNSASATLDGLGFATSNATGTLNMTGNSSLIINGALAVGGGTFARFNTFNVTASTLTVSNTSTFDAYGNLTEGTGGIINFNGNATFNALSSFTMTGGTLNIASGKTLNINGGTATLAGGSALSNGATLSVTSGGTVNAVSYIDIGTFSGATRTGTLSVTGTSSTYTTGASFTDLGRYVNNTGTATFGAGGTGNFNAGLQMAGSGGTATLNVNAGGTVNIASQFIAGSTVAGSLATITLNGGTLNLNSDATLRKGATLNYSSGTLNIASGTTLTVDNANINSTALGGPLSNGATLSLINGGKFTATSYLDIGAEAGATRSGTLSVTGTGSRFQTGSSFTDLGAFVNNTGTATFAAGGQGDFNAGLQLARGGGTATLNINTGGVVNIASNFNNGSNASASPVANVNLAGGALNLTADANFFKGGKFNYSAGTFTFSTGKALTFDSGKGNFTVGGFSQPVGTTINVLNGGSLKVSGYAGISSGVLNVDGLGSLIETSTTTGTDWALNIGDVVNATFTNSGVGNYVGGLTMSYHGKTYVTLGTGATLKCTNGVLYMGSSSSEGATVSISGGAYLQTAGTTPDMFLQQNSTINLGKGYVVSEGALNMNGDAKILAIAGQDPFQTGVQCKTLSMIDTSRIDLTDRSLIVNDFSAGSVTNVRLLLRRGYANGAKNGFGIGSSTVAADPHLQLAYRVYADHIGVGYTSAADATTDGHTNFDDLVPLAQNYNKPSGQLWTDGDFTYDGAVNFDDLVVLAQNYNYALPGFLMAEVSSDFAADWSLARALVPEPTSMLAAFAASYGFMRRRRA